MLALLGPLKERGFVGTRYLGRLRNNPSTPLTYSPNAEHPTKVSRWFRGQNLTESWLWKLVGVFGAAIVTALQGSLAVAALREVAIGSVTTCSMIAIIVLGASILGNAAAFLGIPHEGGRDAGRRQTVIGHRFCLRVLTQRHKLSVAIHDVISTKATRARTIMPPIVCNVSSETSRARSMKVSGLKSIKSMQANDRQTLKRPPLDELTPTETVELYISGAHARASTPRRRLSSG